MQVNENIRAFWRIISNMELIDIEVDWKTNYLKINSFRHIEKGSEEYLEWIGKKVKIKYLGGFDKDYYSQMRLLIEEVRNEFQDLDSDGKKIFIDRINDKLKFIRDCIDGVIELKAMLKHDRESFNHSYFKPTMRLTSNLFIDTLSKPLNMGLVSSSYQTRDFINSGEIIYLSERLLTKIYINLRAREESLIEVLEIFPSFAKFKNIESDDVSSQPANGAEGKKIKLRQNVTLKPQRGGNKVTPLQKQSQIDILKNAVNELCKQNHGKAESERFSVTKISLDAMSKPNLKSEKTLDRYIKDLKLGQTAKQYIRQLVGQFITSNSLNINYFQ